MGLIRQRPVHAIEIPCGGCTEAVINELNNVQAVLDKSQKKQPYSSHTFFQNQDIPVYTGAAHAIAHNKIMIVDQQIVFTASFQLYQSRRRKERVKPLNY